MTTEALSALLLIARALRAMIDGFHRSAAAQAPTPEAVASSSVRLLQASNPQYRVLAKTTVAAMYVYALCQLYL